MAATNLPVNPSFLVFPTGSAEFAWRIVALATGRTIARYKHLENAVERAKLLNFPPPPVLPEPQFGGVSNWVKSDVRGSCQTWFASADSAYGEQCDNSASMSDLDSGLALCVTCWREAHRG